MISSCIRIYSPNKSPEPNLTWSLCSVLSLGHNSRSSVRIYLAIVPSHQHFERIPFPSSHRGYLLADQEDWVLHFPLLSNQTFNMSTTSTTSSNLSAGSPTLSVSESQSAYDTPLTSYPHSPKSDIKDYFLGKSMGLATVTDTDTEPRYPKVNNVCFIGAGFVGMYLRSLLSMRQLLIFHRRWSNCRTRCIPQPPDHGQRR